MKTIDRYFVREVLPPFLLALLLLILALLMNQFLILADVFIARGVRVGKALELLSLLIPSAAAFAFPLAFLAGIVAAVSRLSVDSELTALRALGVPARRLLAPVFLIAAVSFLLTFWLAAFAAPRANSVWVRVMSEAMLGRAGTNVEPGEFNRSIPGTVLFYRSRGEDGSWRDVFACLERGGSGPSGARIILADGASASADRENGRLSISFINGRAFDGLSEASGEYSMTGFSRLDETIDISAMLPSAAPAKSVREKDLVELAHSRVAVRERSGGGHEREARLVEVEIHKKFSLPFLCLVFALFGPSLGLLTGKRGRPAGFALSLLLVFVVYSLYMTAERLAVAGKVAPALSMWLPPLALAMLGAVVLLMTGERAAGAGPRLFRAGRQRLGRVGRKPRERAAESAARSGRGHAMNAAKKTGFFPFAALDRYVFRKACFVLGLAAPAYLLVACLGTAFEYMDEFMRQGKHAALLVKFVLYKTPELLALTLPLAMLTAAIISVGLLARFNELTAMKAAGMSVYRIMGTVAILGLLMSGASFLVGDKLGPPAGARARAILAEVTGQAPGAFDPVGRGWYFDGRSRRIYRYEYFEPGSGRFGRFTVFELDGGRWSLASAVRADEAVLGNDGRFMLRGGTRISFELPAGGGPAVGELAELDAGGAETGVFGPAAVPGQMKYSRLNAYTKRVRKLGFDTGRLEVELAGRVSFPLACLIMAMIGLPAGLLISRRGFVAGAGAAIVVAAVYWGIFAFLRGLGYAGTIPPTVAAWGANAIFGLAALVLMFRAKT